MIKLKSSIARWFLGATIFVLASAVAFYTFAAEVNNGRYYSSPYGVGNGKNYQANTANGAAYSNPITLDLDASTDNGSTAATTVTVSLGTPTAGDIITCEVRIPSGANLTSVADNVNSGSYYPILPTISSSGGFNYSVGILAKENVAASNTTITLTYSSSLAKGAMSCQAWKGVAAKHAADTSIAQMQKQASNSANATASSTIVPFAPNELVLGALVLTSGAATAGTSYTAVDSLTTSGLFPEYWLQQEASSTNAPYTNSATTWIDTMVGIAPSQGFCDSDMVVTFDGGVSDGTVITTSTLAAGTHGNAPLPSSTPNVVTWKLDIGGTASTTFSSAAYAPFVTSLGCPFYAGIGNSGLGIDSVAGVSSGNHGAGLWFGPGSASSSAALCFSTDVTAASSSGNTDVFILRGDNSNVEYNNIAWHSDGTTNHFAQEVGGDSAGTTSFGSAVSSNHQYWLYLQYNQNGPMVAKVYDGCGANPTLLGTRSATSTTSGQSLPTDVHIGIGGSQAPKATGTNWYYGDLKIDAQYGSLLLP